MADAGLLNADHSAPDDAVRIEAGDDIQSVIDQHPAGTTFLLAEGTFSGQTFRPESGDTFYGENGGTVLDGEGAERAIEGFGVSDVRIAGLTFTNYAPPDQGSGVLGTDPSSTGWVVSGNRFTNIEAGPALMLGDGMEVTDNLFADLFSNGISAWQSSGAVIRNNEFANNNTSGEGPFSATGSAAAIKIAEATDTQILDNHIHGTVNGAGIWTDISCDNTLIDGNLVEDNGAGGIFVELDYGSVVSNNTVTGNNTGLYEGFGGGGLYLFNAQDAEVFGNTFAGNGGGIWVYEEEGRGGGDQGEWVTRNVRIYDNSVSADGGQNGIGGDAVGDGSIDFSRNSYDLGGDASFFNGGEVSEQSWTSQGYDVF